MQQLGQQPSQQAYSIRSALPRACELAREMKELHQLPDRIQQTLTLSTARSPLEQIPDFRAFGRAEEFKELAQIIQELTKVSESYNPGLRWFGALSEDFEQHAHCHATKLGEKASATAILTRMKEAYPEMLKRYQEIHLKEAGFKSPEEARAHYTALSEQLATLHRSLFVWNRQKKIDALECARKSLEKLPGLPCFTDPFQALSTFDAAKKKVEISQHMESLKEQTTDYTRDRATALGAALHTEVQTYSNTPLPRELQAAFAELYIRRIFEPRCLELIQSDYPPIFNSGRRLTLEALASDPQIEKAHEAIRVVFTSDGSRERIAALTNELPHWLRQETNVSPDIKTYLSLLIISELSGSQQLTQLASPAWFSRELWGLSAEFATTYLGVTTEAVTRAAEAARSAALTQVSSVEPHTSESNQAGHTLFKLAGPELAPLLIIIAYREPGFSGEMPFLAGTGKQSPIFRFLAGLSADECAELSKRDIPGLDAIIRLIRENPTTFNKAYKPQHDEGSKTQLIENPVYVAIHRHLAKLCMHYLRNGSPGEQFLALGGLQCGMELPQTTREAVLSLLISGPEERVREAILKSIVDKYSRVSSLSEPLIHELGTPTSPALEHLSPADRKALAANLYGNLLNTPLAATTAGQLGTIFGTTGDHFLRVHETLTKSLARPNPYHRDRIPYSGGSLYAKPLAELLALLRATEDRDAPERIAKLVAAGYRHDTSKVALLPHILANYDRVMHELELLATLGVREYAPLPPPSVEGINPRHFSPIRTHLAQLPDPARLTFLGQARDHGGGKMSPLLQEGFLAYALRPQLLEASQFRQISSEFSTFEAACGGLARSDRLYVNLLRCGAALINHNFPSAELTQILPKLEVICRRIGGFSSELLVTAARLWPEHAQTTSGMGEILDALAPVVGRIVKDLGDIDQLVGLIELRRKLLQETIPPGQEIDQVCRFSEEFGARYLPEVFTGWIELDRGNPPTEGLRACGVTGMGKEGQRQLRTHMNRIFGSLIERDGTIEVNSAIDAEILSLIVRFKLSQWKQSASLWEIVRSFNADRSRGLIARTPEFLSSGVIKVEKLDSDALAEFRYTQECQTRFAQLQDDLALAAAVALPQLIQRELLGLTKGLKTHEATLRAPLTAEEATRDKDGKRAQHRLRRADEFAQCCAAVTSLLTSSDKSSLKKTISILSDFDRGDNSDTTDALRRLVLAHALDHATHAINIDLLCQASLSPDSLGQLSEVIQDIVLGQGIPTIGLDPKSRGARRLKEIFSVKSLSAELTRLQSVGSNDFEEWHLIPNRAATEFTANISDACWARVQNIARSFPNFTPVLFARDPSSSDGKLIGACFLIEAENDKGERVLVIRGNNPQQNHITRVSAESFFEGFVEWLAPQAQAAGFAEIVMPMDGCTASQTNRPTLSDYLMKRYRNKPPVVLADAPQTTFNGYDIRRLCVEVRDLRG